MTGTKRFLKNSETLSTNDFTGSNNDTSPKLGLRNYMLLIHFSEIKRFHKRGVRRLL